jgi:hypothetical protein
MHSDKSHYLVSFEQYTSPEVLPNHSIFFAGFQPLKRLIEQQSARAAHAVRYEATQVIVDLRVTSLELPFLSAPAVSIRLSTSC